MRDGELIENPGSGATLSAEIVKLFSETERIGIRRFEESDSAELVAQLTPSVLALIERACDILRILLERYESEEDALDAAMEAEGIPEGEILQLRSAPRPPAAVIGDLSFVAIAELRQHLHRLQAHRPSSERKEILSDCGSALRAIRKSLYAIEPLLCAVERTPRLLPPRLGTSLEVRRQYHKLWSFVASTVDVDSSTVRSSLRGAGTRIAMLSGCEIFHHLREDDRFRIRELQGRILEWLRDGDDEVAAVQLWQDFALFVEMLRQVNLREELLEHDRKVLRAATAALAERGEEAVSEVCQMLAMIAGVDDALDQLVRRGPRAAQLAVELARLRAQLSDPQEADKADRVSTTVAL
jgi:hypothetical protein